MLAKRTIPLLIAALIGFLLIATYFIPFTEEWGATAMEMFIILAAAAMVLGASHGVARSYPASCDATPCRP